MMKPFYTSTSSASNSGGQLPPIGNFGNGWHYGNTTTLHHINMKSKRKRTVSADSGCDVNVEMINTSEPNPAILEETVRIWANRLETVLQQEVNCARQMSDASKQALFIADYEVRERVLRSWKDQLIGIMDLTADLIQCVNNDIKESLMDSSHCSPLHSSREEFPLVKEEAEDYDVIKDDLHRSEQEDAALSSKLRDFLADDNYFENFDYCDQASFETVSLSGDECENDSGTTIETDEPFKPLASDSKAKSDPDLSHRPVAKTTRRRIRKKLGFSRGYFTCSAKRRSKNAQDIIKWIKGTKNQFKCCANHQELAASKNPSKTPPKKQPRQRNEKTRKYKQQRPNLLKTKRQIRRMIRKLRDIQIEQIRFCRGEDMFLKRKMFHSVLSQEDLFEEWRWILEDQTAAQSDIFFAEWKWNLDEYEKAEDIFDDWKWNIETVVDENYGTDDLEIKAIFEEQQVEDIFNDWIWNMKETDEIEEKFNNWKKNILNCDNWQFWQHFGSKEEIMNNTEEIVEALKRMDLDDDSIDWTMWEFWNKFGSVSEILNNAETVELATCHSHQEYFDNTDYGDISIRDVNNNISDEDEMENIDVVVNFDDSISTDSGEYSDTEMNDSETDFDEYLEDFDNDHFEDFVNDNEQQQSWQNWRFWNEIGSVKEILENNTDLMVFGCFEDFVWVASEEFLKDIGYLGGVVIGEYDPGCLGDDEYESLLDNRKDPRSSITTQKSSANLAGSSRTVGDYGSIKRRRRKEKRRKQEEIMQQRKHNETKKVCKYLNDDNKIKRKSIDEYNGTIVDKIHVTDDYFDRHMIFKSLAPSATDPNGIIFWDDSDREIDSCFCLQEPQSAVLRGPRDQQEIIFWEDSSRDTDDDLIHWDSADDIYIRRIITENTDTNHFELFFDSDITDMAAQFADNEDENKENEPWRAYKLMGPLWVDVEGQDGLADDEAAAASSPPALQVLRKRSSRKRRGNPLVEITVTDVNDIMWRIETNGRPNSSSLAQELSNLPFWEAPDVFRDACELIESSSAQLPPPSSLAPCSPAIPSYAIRMRPKDPLSTFRTWRYLFTEPKSALRTPRKRKSYRIPSLRQIATAANNSAIVEDIFSDWSQWAWSEKENERGRWLIPAGDIQTAEVSQLRRLEAKYVRGRQNVREKNLSLSDTSGERRTNTKQNKRNKTKRADSPTVAYSTSITPLLQSWTYSHQPGMTGKRWPIKRSPKPVQKGPNFSGCCGRIFQPSNRGGNSYGGRRNQERFSAK